MGSSGSDSSKERLRWTHELHDRFVEAVTKLGGPDRATPKGILKAMDVSGLTIYHINSHLQYRISKFIPESTTSSKLQKKNISEMLPYFGTTSAAQLSEALKIMQMQVQRRLSDHNEVQKSLKHKFAAEGRFLDKISADRRNNKRNHPILITKPSKLPFPRTSLPSLCEDSEFSNAKEFAYSDSSEAADKSNHEAQSSAYGQFQGLKRLRLHQPDYYNYDHVQLALNSEFYINNAQTHSLLLPHDEDPIIFPWNFPPSCSSPLLPTCYL